MDPITLLAGVLPFAQHVGRVILGKWAKGAGAEPQTVAEAVKLGELELRRMEAIARMESSIGSTSVWVANVRAMQRPIVAMLALTTWVCLSLMPNTDPDTYTVVSNVASSVFSYLFGDRTAMKIFRRGS